MRVASTLRVLFAQLFDGALVGGLALGASLLVGPALVSDEAPKTEGFLLVLELVLMNPIVLAAFAGVALAVSTLQHVALVPAVGGTFGGLLTGVRLISRSNGKRPGAARAALRGLFGAAGALLLLLGPLFALWLDPLRRGAGDVVAGTLPVRR